MRRAGDRRRASLDQRVEEEAIARRGDRRIRCESLPRLTLPDAENVLATPHIGYVSHVLQDVLRGYRLEYSEVA